MKVSFLMTNKPHWDQKNHPNSSSYRNIYVWYASAVAVLCKACDRNAEANYRINQIWQVIYGDMRNWDLGILENSSKKKYCNQKFRSMEERK